MAPPNITGVAKMTMAPWAGGLSGRLENVYFAQTPQGTIVRPLPQRTAPPTPGEVAQRRRIAAVARAWNALDRDAMVAWKVYAEGRDEAPAGARTAGMSAYNAFSSLASTRLRVRPDEPIPSLPPSGPFFGDAIVVTAADGPQALFRASGANAAGVATELLLQPLKSAGRTPRPKAYVSARFVAFAAGGLTATVAVAPGWYACAYRFVLVATGQETALAPCGIVRVG